MGSLLVVTGPPGAGKSTVAPALAQAESRSVLVQGDVFFGFLAAGAIAPWLPESDAQNEVVTRALAASVGTFVRGGYATVVDGVLGPWFLPTFVEAAGLDRVDYVVLLPPVEVCVDRVAGRVGHGFADEPATRHMHSQFADAPIEERHLVRDVLDDPDAVVKRVLDRRAAGDLTLSSG